MSCLLPPTNPLAQPTFLPSTLFFGGFSSDMVTQKLRTSAGPSLECFSLVSWAGTCPVALGRSGCGQEGPGSSMGHEGWQKPPTDALHSKVFHHPGPSAKSQELLILRRSLRELCSCWPDHCQGRDLEFLLILFPSLSMLEDLPHPSRCPQSGHSVRKVRMLSSWEDGRGCAGA